MTDQVFTLTMTELEKLHGTGALPIAIYCHLRAWMDYASGTVGRTRTLSLGMLAAYCESHTPRGQGTQIEQPSQKAIRTSLERLQRNGLLRRLAGDNLHFALPLALTASVRPNQTRHSVGTVSDTTPGTVTANTDAGFKPVPVTVSATPTAPNPAHIRFTENLSSTSTLAEVIHSQGISTTGKEAIIDRWTQQGITSQQVKSAVNKARAVRAAEGSLQPLNVGLIDSILKAPPAPPRAHSNDDLLKAGQAVGVQPRPGESWDQYRARLAQAA